MSWWHAIVDYYKTIGQRFSVKPVVFVGIHLVATPVLMVTIWWLIRNYRKKRSIALPLASAILVFNAANIYLIAAGKNIPWWVYAFVATTTLISGYLTYQNVRKRLAAAS